MKRYIAFLTIVLALAASCAKQQPTGEKYLAAPALQTSTGTVSFEAAGGSSSVSVPPTITAKVVASADRDWVTVNVSGRDVNLSVSANESIETRYAVVTVKAGSQSRNVQIIQFGTNTKFIWEEEYAVSYEGETLSLEYKTDATVRLSIDVDWISAAAEDGVLNIVVAKNPLKEAREGSVVWKAGEDQRTIAIKQALNPGGSSGGGDEPPAGAVIFSEDFEDVDTLDEWLLIDADGDGFYWNYNYQTNLAAHSGTGKMFSQSYDSETSAALTPDNWVFTPAITLASSNNYLSFWVVPQDGAYPKEHYGVYVTTSAPQSAADLDACTKILEGTLTQGYQTSSVGPKAVGTWENPIVKIPSEFDGKTVYIAFRHFNCTDWFYINLDDVLVTKGEPSAAASSLYYAPASFDAESYIVRK
jgi:hypothetical protein